MHRFPTLSLVLIFLTTLGPSCGAKCTQGYGVDQDGECVPFKHGEGDADTDVGNPADGELEMIGDWVNENDEAVVITSSTWTETVDAGEETMLFHIEVFSNEDNFLVALNDEDNADDGGAWSRFDWSLDSEGAWACPTECCAETKEEALNVTPPDSSEFSNGGCGIEDKPWSRLTRD